MFSGTPKASTIDQFLAVGLAFEVQMDAGADVRARAVGADEIAGAYDRFGAAARSQYDAHAVAVLTESHHLDAGAGGHGRLALGVRAQRALELRLVEGDQLRMTVDGPCRVDPGEFAEMRAVHAHLRNDDLGERVLPEPDHLQNAQRLVVERDRARRHPDVGQLVEH